MVTIETLRQAGMSEAEAGRVLELYGTEPGESVQESGPDKEASKDGLTKPSGATRPERKESARAQPEEPAQAEAEDPVQPKPEERDEWEFEDPARTQTPPESPKTEEAPGKPAPDYAAENAVLRARLIESELRAAGMAAGVPPERLRTLARLADTSQVDVTQKDAGRQIADAVAAALKEVPELASTPFAAGSLGAHLRDPARPIDPFARGLMGQ